MARIKDLKLIESELRTDPEPIRRGRSNIATSIWTIYDTEGKEQNVRISTMVDFPALKSVFFIDRLGEPGKLNANTAFRFGAAIVAYLLGFRHNLVVSEIIRFLTMIADEMDERGVEQNWLAVGDDAITITIKVNED